MAGNDVQRTGYGRITCGWKSGRTSVSRKDDKPSEAATAAANAATQALSSMSTRASTGLESAARILKAPDVFTGEDPMIFQTWKFQVSSWLSFGDQRFQEVSEKVEALKDDPADTSTL